MSDEVITVTNPSYAAYLASEPGKTILAQAQQIQALQSQVDALRADATRLDWMDSVAFTAYSHRDPFTGTTSHATVVNEDEGRRSGRKGNVGDSIRKAIDKARGFAPATGGKQEGE